MKGLIVVTLVGLPVLVELITHLAFYAGWPSAMSAISRAKELLGKEAP